MKIYSKLLDVQQKLKAPKDQFNSFGKYNYRSCESILEALKPHLQENKLTLVLSDEIKEVGGRVYVQASATVFDTETGDACRVTAYAREEDAKKGMDASQVTGAASSYARKYALNGLFSIDDNKDSDATNHGDTEVRKPVSTNDEVAKLTQHDEDGYFIVCADCGKKMRDQPRKDGTVYSVQDYVAACLRNYQRPICKTCREKKNDPGQAS